MPRNTSGLRRGGPGRPKGVPNKATIEQKKFLQEILDSEEYRESFKKRVVDGDPGLEQMMHHYVLGKPKDTLALETAPPLLIIDELTDADVIAMKQAKDDA